MKAFFATLGLVLLDQGSKYWAQENLLKPLELWNGVALRLSENTGIAFSLPLPPAVTIPLTGLVVGYLAWQIWKKKSPQLTQIALILILAGAIGNLIDRVFLGAVTDFIVVYQFPVFNLADSFISLGVVLYLWQEVIGGEK